MAARTPQELDRDRWKTQRRRLLNPLWRALDAHVLPHLSTGALLCVSGGDDSMAMMEGVARWPKRHLGEIHVASVDHGHRQSAAAEVELVCARARYLGFESHPLRARSRFSNEGDLREARYACLEDCAKSLGLGSLISAHHRSDLSEARLLSQLGAFSQGEMSAHSDHDPMRIKPFLEVPREVLLSAPFAPFSVHDTIDEEGGGERGFYRKNLAPTLDALYPNHEVQLHQSGNYDAQAADLIKQSARDRIRFHSDRAELDLPCHPAIIRLSVPMVCAHFAVNARFRHGALREVVAFCASPQKREMICGELRLEVRKNILFFSRRVLPSA